ncbi:MAG: lipopolysaccharide assembly protein LapA domain-containing protein [Solirubrobacteraceae bacterium]
MSSTSGSSAGRKAKQRRSRADVVRTALWVVLAVLITLFAVLNVESVKVNWIFGKSSAPLIIVIVISLLVGVVLTYIADRRFRKR